MRAKARKPHRAEAVLGLGRVVLRLHPGHLLLRGLVARGGAEAIHHVRVHEAANLVGAVDDAPQAQRHREDAADAIGNARKVLAVEGELAAELAAGRGARVQGDGKVKHGLHAGGARRRHQVGAARHGSGRCGRPARFGLLREDPVLRNDARSPCLSVAGHRVVELAGVQVHVTHVQQRVESLLVLPPDRAVQVQQPAHAVEQVRGCLRLTRSARAPSSQREACNSRHGDPLQGDDAAGAPPRRRGAAPREPHAPEQQCHARGRTASRPAAALRWTPARTLTE